MELSFLGATAPCTIYCTHTSVANVSQYTHRHTFFAQIALDGTAAEGEWCLFKQPYLSENGLQVHHRLPYASALMGWSRLMWWMFFRCSLSIFRRKESGALFAYIITELCFITKLMCFKLNYLQLYRWIQDIHSSFFFFRKGILSVYILRLDKSILEVILV